MKGNPEEALFKLALGKLEAERAAFLDRECGNDKALRARIEALLAAHEQTVPELESSEFGRDEFHESPTKDPGRAELGPPLAVPRQPVKIEFAEEPKDEAMAQVIGYQKVLQKIGEGGCAAA